MTVGELIEKLQQWPPDMPVCYPVHEFGKEDVESLDEVEHWAVRREKWAVVKAVRLS